MFAVDKEQFCNVIFSVLQNRRLPRRENYYRFCDMDDKWDVHATVLSPFVVRCVLWLSYYVYVFYLRTLPITKTI